MNTALAREIYGGQPWCMDQFSYRAYNSLLNDLRKGVVLEIPEIKSNSPFVLVQGKDKRVIKDTYQLRNDDDFNGVGLIQLDGPITKKGGMSTYGMVQLTSIMNRMAKDDRINSFIIYADSGGGSSAAVDILSDTILEINESKPVYGLIEKGGMAASAAYGILSACRSIHAISKLSLVGSVGTMVQFEGRAANSEDPYGNKHIRLYATKSIKKNEDFEEALNKDNYEIIVSELLDPINEDFIKKTLKNRPQLKGSGFDNGHHLFAKDAVGTFIDGFKTFDQMVEVGFKQNKSTSGSKSNINPNSNKMTAEELKQKHPETYNSIFKAGVSAESDRVGAWLAHHGTNQETVLNGINSGKAITQTETQQLLVEAASKNQLQQLENESAKPVNTKETPLSKDKDAPENAEEVKNFYDQVDNKLKVD
ncbi:hypothetical protein [Flagellimonas nanhaiensis]|uniref:Peptidase S49 domain-containing protein n=1 Tax=Flagellimonas nanhaiensis TaxID=2292706 RepID=A0A371JL71_9FLAO|nr:hypothetical protein [Allomuricauda nanhaiensis]RDY57705.1 hypothetical protein DX873_17545 [Allomuricauda nanhaiensis]